MIKSALLLLTISLTATAKEPSRQAVADDSTVTPSADFLELTKAYQNRSKVAPKNNAFIYLVGLTAPKDTDPMTFGQQVIDWSNQKIANGGKSDIPEPEVPYALGTDYENFMEKITCNIHKETPCALAEHQDPAYKIINNKADLLQRRQELLILPDYENTMTIDLMAYFPHYGTDIRLQQLALMELWLNRNDYPPEKIKQALQKDYDFRVKQSANAVTLIEKMIADAGLRNNYYWLNEILKSVDSDTAASLTPRYLHEPIPLSVLSMRLAYIGELQFFMSLFKPQNIGEEFNPVACQFNDNDKQHLFNYQATLLKKIITFSELPHYQILLKELETDKNIQQYIALMTALDKKSGGRWSEVTFGNTPFEQFVWSIARYIERPQQLAAVQKAVAVLQKIRRQDIKPTDIPDFLQQTEQHNPLTQKPFNWDDDKQQIIIEIAEKQAYYLLL